MKLNVVFLAAFRDVIGHEKMIVELEKANNSVEDLVAKLCDGDQNCQHAFVNEPGWQVAINHELGHPESTINAEDEIAFFPPFSGG